MTNQDHSEREIEMMVEGASRLLTDTWPDDRLERIESKLDKVLGNHLPHVEARISRLERLFLQKQRWAFWTGLLTAALVLYVIIR